MATFILEVGISTAGWRAWMPLRMRVSMSAIGSVIMARLLLPARLHDAGDLALECELPEADPTQAELPHVGPRAATALAAVVLAHRVRLGEGVRPLRLHDHRDFCHWVSLPLPDPVGRLVR